MRKKKKISLMHFVGCRHIKLWARNVARSREIDLPERLSEQPFFGNNFRNLCGGR